MKDRRRVTWTCYPFILFGSSAKQFAFGLVGLVILSVVFRSHPNTGFEWAGIRPLVPVSLVAMMLLAGGIIEGAKTIKILNGGEIVSARLSKILEDREPEDIEYKLFLEYTDSEDQIARLHAVREVNNLPVGQCFPLLINRALGVGLLEPNLPGGITFANK
jgi:hypothetical protein